MSKSREEILEFLLSHYQNPQFKGHTPNATFTKSGGNPGCADVVEISARIGEDDRIDEILFDGQGCTISMAAADYLAEIAQGKTLEEIEAMTTDQLLDELGRDVVMTRPSCATSAFHVLKQAVHEELMRRK